MGILLVEVLDHLGHDFRVGLGLEDVTLLLEEPPDVIVVGDDAVVDHDEAVRLVGPKFM